jgi:hypothetical protein
MAKALLGHLGGTDPRMLEQVRLLNRRPRFGLNQPKPQYITVRTTHGGGPRPGLRRFHVYAR